MSKELAEDLGIHPANYLLDFVAITFAIYGRDATSIEEIVEALEYEFELILDVPLVRDLVNQLDANGNFIKGAKCPEWR